MAVPLPSCRPMLTELNDLSFKLAVYSPLTLPFGLSPSGAMGRQRGENISVPSKTGTAWGVALLEYRQIPSFPAC